MFTFVSSTRVNDFCAKNHCQISDSQLPCGLHIDYAGSETAKAGDGIPEPLIAAETEVSLAPLHIGLILPALKGRNGCFSMSATKRVNVSGGIISIGHLPICVYSFRLRC